MKKVGFIILSLVAMVGCKAPEPPKPVSAKSIVILYENDVHCAIDGYTKLAGLRDAIAASDTVSAARYPTATPNRKDASR